MSRCGGSGQDEERAAARTLTGIPVLAGIEELWPLQNAGTGKLGCIWPLEI